MTRISAVLLAAILLSSCGKSDSSGSGGSPSAAGGGTGGAATTGGATPQEAFDKLKATGEKKDWPAFYDLIHPEEKDMAVFMFSFIGAMAGMGDEAKKAEFEAIGKKHGVPDEDKAEKLEMNDPEKMKSQLKVLFKDVKDKKALFVEMAAWVDANSKPGDGFNLKPDATLKSVKEEGDTARCMTLSEGKERPMVMKKHGGRWYMTFDR